MKAQSRSLLLLVLGLALVQFSNCQGNALQIVTHYQTMDDRYASKTGTEKDKYLFSKQIMIRVVKYYSAAMTVKTAAKQYQYTEFTFDDGNKLPAGTFTGHLFTVFDCYNKADTGFAAAGFQDKDTNGRPISGIFHLNLNAINPSPKNALAHYGTFVHEFYHILTFNKDLFGSFIDGAGNAIGSTNIIGTDGSRSTYKFAGDVLTFAKSHLGDNSLTAVTLENGGGAGSANSHWEYDYWPNDFMSPIDTLPSLLSPLSLYMSKDSGWYGVNDNYADPLIYGKNAGANFQSTASCPGDRNPQPLGFCATGDKGKSFCSPDGMYKGVCGSDDTYNADGKCPFIMGTLYCTVPSSDYTGQVNYDVEIIGAGSRCAAVKSSSGYTTACATTTCSGGSVTYTFVGSKTCTCTSGEAGSEKSCGGLTVKCPDATSLGLLCDSLDSSKQKCPNDCSGKGFCLGLTAGTKQCWCTYGWMGTDCSTANSDEPELTSVGKSTTPNKKNANIKAIGFYIGALVMILTSFI